MRRAGSILKKYKADEDPNYLKIIGGKSKKSSPERPLSAYEKIEN